MGASAREKQEQKRKSPAVRVAWAIAQLAVFLVGLFIVAMLLVQPELGLFLLWDVLIPIAPLLLVVAAGVWRNVCPLATFSMLPHRLNISQRKPVPLQWQSRFFMMAVLLLFLIVPLRHAVLDKYGVVTGVVLMLVAVLSFGLGLIFDWKAAWCSGLCPVYPVELLYGQRPVLTVPNVQCRTCTNCVAPCRDSKKGMTPLDITRQKNGRLAALVFIGCFPGFVLGWYSVSLSPVMSLPAAIFESYLWPCLGAIASLIIFLILYKAVGNHKNLLVRIFAALAISIYYWFKLPVVLGLSGDASHALLNVGSLTPDWTIWPVRLIFIGLLCYLLVGRSALKGWTMPPRRMEKPTLTPFNRTGN